MYPTDIFIRRPVLALALNLLILILGLRSIGLMQVLQFPHTQSGVVTVTTVYPGASADTVAGFITTPLEAAIARSDGIDYMTSTSTQSVSTIVLNLKLNYDADKALPQVMAAVDSVSNQMPPQAQKSVVSLSQTQTVSSLYASFTSKTLQQNQITDYVLRVVQPKLQAVPGVQQAQIFGGKIFAIRVWLDPDKLAAYQLSAAQIYSALGKHNVLSAAGKTRGAYVQVNLAASTDLQTIEGFNKMVVGTDTRTGAPIRLRDIARVELGSEEYDDESLVDGMPSVIVAIQTAPSANTLSVVRDVKKTWEDIRQSLPEGLEGTIDYDATRFILSSIHEVIATLAEALVVVGLVVFAFLGSPRAVIIPIVAVPLSLVGAFFVMFALGFSINLLTLLALVLGIGLVVDDAIIVVENVNRHLEEKKTPLEASVLAARELCSPIIAMTVVLAAAYAPIGFMGGLTGSLFSEFAFTLVGAVTISAIVALTLSPVMCSRILVPQHAIRSRWERQMVGAIDRAFGVTSKTYRRLLRASLDAWPVTIFVACIVLSSLYFLYGVSQKELAPNEDQGIVVGLMSAPPTATLQQKRLYASMGFDIMRGIPERERVFSIVLSSGQIIQGNVLKSWSKRKRTAESISAEVQGKFSAISGVQAASFSPPSLPGSGGMPVQFVIQTTNSFEDLSRIADLFMSEARATDIFFYLDKDLHDNTPQTTFEIDRNKASQMGFDMQMIGAELTALLSQGYVNYFSYAGRAYQVIPQIDTPFRASAQQILGYRLKAPSGAMVPLGTMASIKTVTVPESINHFQQLNSVTIRGYPFSGFTTGDALVKLNAIAKDLLPEGYYVDYAGSMRQMVKESSSFGITFLFALIIIFLILSAQFESFRDPFIILMSVPMSLFGALFFMSFRLATLNIYTEVGLVTLIGLVSKHGILIVQFANKLRQEGLSKRDAVERAASIRLRPILMTTAAMVLGVVPLLLASGAGATSRFQIGLVISSGLLVGTCFTIFVVPAFYLLLAQPVAPNQNGDGTR